MTTALIFGFFNHSYMAVPDSASKPLFPSSEIPTVHICVNRCFSCARAIAGKKNRLRSNTIYAKYKDGTALSRSNRWQGIASPHPHPLPVSGRFFLTFMYFPGARMFACLSRVWWDCKAGWLQLIISIVERGISVSRIG